MKRKVSERIVFKGRGYRLNYYAIQAMLARVYMYAGKTTEALQYAEGLIEYQKRKNILSFKTSRNLVI